MEGRQRRTNQAILGRIRLHLQLIRATRRTGFLSGEAQQAAIRPMRRARAPARQIFRTSQTSRLAHRPSGSMQACEACRRPGTRTKDGFAQGADERVFGFPSVQAVSTRHLNLTYHREACARMRECMPRAIPQRFCRHVSKMASLAFGPRTRLMSWSGRAVTAEKRAMR